MRNLIFVFICIVFIWSCTSHQDERQTNDNNPNYKDGLYINNHVEHPDKSFFSFLKMRWFGDDEWANHELAKHLIPQTDSDIERLFSSTNQVTWLGHSTFLIQFKGMNILTDPMFSDRASPVSFAGPKRYTKVAMQISELPDIDYVIISHNHYDHLDEASIKTLGNQVQYIVPMGLKTWFEDIGILSSNITELKWWQNADFDGLQFTATPSQHWSARGLGDRNQTHWASWLVTHKQTAFWFAGDTGYNDKDFVDIGNYVSEQKLDLELALIPIGAYAPRSFMKTYHVNTEEAVQIHRDIGSKFSIGMHWGAFPLTAEWPMEPFEWLNKLRIENKLGSEPFITIKIGETTEFLKP